MITIRDAASAAKAFTHALNGSVVSAEEIRRRGGICNACPKRKFIRTRASKMSRTLGLLANRHRLPSDIKDYVCGVCGCSLMLLLPATPPDLPVDNEKEAAERPDKCWILTERTKSA